MTDYRRYWYCEHHLPLHECINHCHHSWFAERGITRDELRAAAIAIDDERQQARYYCSPNGCHGQLTGNCRQHGEAHLSQSISALKSIATRAQQMSMAQKQKMEMVKTCSIQTTKGDANMQSCSARSAVQLRINELESNKEAAERELGFYDAMIDEPVQISTGEPIVLMLEHETNGCSSFQVVVGTPNRDGTSRWRGLSGDEFTYALSWNEFTQRCIYNACATVCLWGIGDNGWEILFEYPPIDTGDDEEED